METDFLASTKHFLYFFIGSCQGKLLFLSNGNVSLNESFIQAIGEGFFSLLKTVTLLESFLLLAETVMRGKQFVKTELILAGGN